MSTRVPSSPGPSYDQKWMYWFWDWIRANRPGNLTSLVQVGDVLGTSTTGTFTAALSTTGVIAGTYGGTAGVPRFDVSAKGRILSGTNVAFPASTLVAVGAITGTNTTGTLTAAFNPNPAFTGTGTAAGWLVSGTSTGAMSQWGTATGGFARWGTSSASLVRGAQVAALLGSSTTFGNAGVMGTHNLVPTTRTIQAIYTYAACTTPLNAILGTGNGVCFRAWGTFGGAIPTRFATVFGSGTLLVGTATSQVTDWQLAVDVLAISDTTQAYRCRFDTQSAAQSVRQLASGTLALATGSAFLLSVVGTQGTSSINQVCQGWYSNFRNGP